MRVRARDNLALHHLRRKSTSIQVFDHLQKALVRKFFLYRDLLGLLWMLESPRVCFHLMLNLILVKSWDGVVRSLIIVMAAGTTILQRGCVRGGIAHGADATGDGVKRPEESLRWQRFVSSSSCCGIS